MANQNWKARAESMISSFMDGEVDGNPYFYSQLMDMENTSKDDFDASSACGSNNNDSVYDRLLLGCGYGYCNKNTLNNNNDHNDGQCVSLAMHWARVVLGGATKAYLSSPICLALLPLVMGLGIGYFMGKRGGEERADSSDRKQIEGQQRTSLFGRLGKFYHWLSLQLQCMVLLLHLNPFFGTKSIISSTNDDLFQEERDEQTRTNLNAIESKRESGVDPTSVPRHIAVIMDGNRRYGKAKYNNATRGHWDGSKTLIEFSKWCIAEGVQILTVYAFSTENWDRDPAEVSALMAIFCKYCDELRVEAIQRGIRIHVLATEEERIPVHVKEGIDRMVEETRHCDQFTMNICLSYGGRGEIVNACKSIISDVQSGKLTMDQVNENQLGKQMLTKHCCDPDCIIRTSGEERISNFLLWQVAYSEFFFLEKCWPELDKEDLLEVIRTFANGRQRRYGK